MPQFVISFLLGLLLIGAAPIPTASIQPLQMADPKGGLPRTICTVFSINEQDHLWATAAHCVVDHDDEGHPVPTPVLLGGVNAVAIFVDERSDVAVVRAEIGAPSIKLGKHPELGDSIRVYGFMWGAYSPTLFDGKVANLAIQNESGRQFMLFGMFAGPGHSGSPILDVDGRVVSVLQAGWGDGYNGGALYGYLDELTPYWK